MRWLVLAAACAFGCSDARAYDLDGGDLARLGATFAQQRGCATCHDDGSGRFAGQTTPLVGSAAFGTNLTPDRQTGVGGWADVELVRAIRYGLDNAGHELCPAMPRFSTMGDLEARAIVAWMRGLPSVSRAVPDSMCPPLKPLPSPDMAMAGDM